VEIIRALQTSDETYEKTEALAIKMGKQTVLSQDVPGFIANRILMPWINEAIFCLQEGVATKESIDKCMKLGKHILLNNQTK
jgi:3-hydroxybutyryl-CoA dehydrogenase